MPEPSIRSFLAPTEHTNFWFKPVFSAILRYKTFGSGERLLVQTGFLVQGHPREEIRDEFRVKMGSSGKRADLVIFPEGAAQKQENVWAIIECKAENIPPSHKKEGVEQLKQSWTGSWTQGNLVNLELREIGAR